MSNLDEIREKLSKEYSTELADTAYLLQLVDRAREILQRQAKMFLKESADILDFLKDT
jgi:hypothetical protein